MGESWQLNLFLGFEEISYILAFYPFHFFHLSTAQITKYY